MNAPNSFLAAVAAGMLPGQPPPPPDPSLDLPADTITPNGAQMAPAPAVYNAPPQGEAWKPPDPLKGLGPAPNKPGAGFGTGYDPLADYSPQKLGNVLQAQGIEAGPPAPPGGVAPPGNTNAVPGGPGPAVNVNGQGDFPLVAAGGGGVVPAHEVDTRGPSLTNAQNATQGAEGQAIEANTANSQKMAQDEYNMYLGQERQARAREAAWQQSVAERDEELGQRQSDFDNSVKTLSRTSIDPNRFWSTRSTGQKVSAMISLALGGFLQGARGGNNPGMDMINTAIDRDVRAQEAQFQVARDVVGARQTAFSLAAQKYQNVDAARSMARAAAIDTVQAQMAQNAALWKDTEAANRANSAIAALQQEKMGWIAQGIRFVLPQQVGRSYVDPKTGLRYTEAEAKSMAHEMRSNEQAREMQGLKTAGDVMVEGVKGSLKKDDTDKQLAKDTQAFNVHSQYLGSIANQLVGENAKGSLTSKIGAQHLPYPTDAHTYRVKLDKYNSEVDTIVGHWAKAEEGKIPVEEFRRLVGRFEIDPMMPDTEKIQRIDGLKRFVDERAKTAGVNSAGEVTGGAPAGQLPPSAVIHRAANGR